MGERIAIMRDGDIIQIGAPEEVITTPVDDYVREFCQDASMAKVLTASTIMDQPRVLLYDWQGPKAALKILQNADVDSAFLLTRQRKFLGLVTVPRLAKLIKNNGTSLMGAIELEPGVIAVLRIHHTIESPHNAKRARELLRGFDNPALDHHLGRRQVE